MNDWSKFEQFLTTDPDDAGCAETFDLIDAYVELILIGGGADERYPRLAAHLRSCHPCAEDFEGLLLAAAGSSG